MSKSARQSKNLMKEERTMTKRELEAIIRINRFDNIVLKDIQEGRTIIPKGAKLIIGDTTISVYSQGWTTKKSVRVAGYWVKQKSGREVFKIVRGLKYINRRLEYEGIDKEYLINPRFAFGSKEYQF